MKRRKSGRSRSEQGKPGQDNQERFGIEQTAATIAALMGLDRRKEAAKPIAPVCFGSMYSGLMPEEHGIMKYEKPVLMVETLFDDLIGAGRKPAIVCTEEDSIAKIFLGRQMDYYFYPTKEECNAKALDLIREDRHDLIVLYNGDYDANMHHHSPKGKRALTALHENIVTFLEMRAAVRTYWSMHDTVTVFAPDHGCHRVWLIFGNHGINKPCDRHLYHLYGFLPSDAAAKDAQAEEVEDVSAKDRKEERGYGGREVKKKAVKRRSRD